MKKNTALILGIIIAVEAIAICFMGVNIYKVNNKSKEAVAEVESAGELNEGLKADNESLAAENESMAEANSVLESEKESLNALYSEASNQILSYEEYVDELNERLLEIEDIGEGTKDKKYQSIYPDMYASEYIAAESEGKIAYLTFDDGPSNLTPHVLDVLDEYDVKATFFVTYKESEDLQKYYKEIVDRGHTIAVHTASHDYEDIYKSIYAYMDDFYKMYDCIYEETGVRCSLFRFPGGSHNGYNYGNDMPSIILEMERRGFKYYDWNVSTGDGGNWVTPDDILNRVKDQSAGRDRLVVLMHDSASKNATLEALPNVIEYLKSEGYTFGALSSDVEPVQFTRWLEE